LFVGLFAPRVKTRAFAREFCAHHRGNRAAMPYGYNLPIPGAAHPRCAAPASPCQRAPPGRRAHPL